MENTNFDYSIQIAEKRLYISSGYIASEDLRAEFDRCLDQIERSGVSFVEFPGPIEAVYGSKILGIKTFPCSSKWYGVITPGTQIPEYNDQEMKKLLLHDLELDCFRGSASRSPDSSWIISKLLGTFQYPEGECHSVNSDSIFVDIPKRILDSRDLQRALGLHVMKLLGYSIDVQSVEEFDIPIGYDTITDGSSVLTSYYYLSTNGRKIGFTETSGTVKSDPNLLVQIQRLINRGYFLTPKIIGIIQRYPGFIPSYPPKLRSIR